MSTTTITMTSPIIIHWSFVSPPIPGGGVGVAPGGVGVAWPVGTKTAW